MDAIPRRVRIEDLPSVGHLLDDVFRRSRGVYDQSQLTDFPLVFSPDNLSNNWLIECDSRIVSHAGLWPRTLIVRGVELRAAIVVSVATASDYRLRGFAAQLMLSLQQHIQQQALDLAILWTSVPDFYVKLGWELSVPRGVVVEIPAEYGSATEYNPEMTVRPYDPKLDLAAVLELYNSNPVRLWRNEHQAAALLTLPKVPIWVALRSGRIVAYLALGQAINKQGVAEYSGDIEGIVCLLKHIRTLLPQATPLKLLIYHTRQDLWDWAVAESFPAHPLPSSKGTNYEMIFSVRANSIPQSVRDDLFVWGLDHA